MSAADDGGSRREARDRAAVRNAEGDASWRAFLHCLEEGVRRADNLPGESRLLIAVAYATTLRLEEIVRDLRKEETS